jgi:FlaA1/EpsC-like NDP-sugar epimerase
MTRSVSSRVRRALITWALQHRLRAKVGFDALAWAFGVALATVIRYELALREVDWGSLLLVVLLAMPLQVAIGVASGLYRGHWRAGSFDEVGALAVTGALTTAVLTGLNVVLGMPRLVPLSGTIGGGLAALAIMAAGRIAWRAAIDAARRPSFDRARPLLVFGAGEGGAEILTSLLRNPASAFVPVALLDDDPGKRNLIIAGVPVRGTRADMSRVADTTGADTLLIAIPSAGSALIRELAKLAHEADLEVKVLPRLAEVLTGRVDAADIRDLTEADLLGRHEIDTDLAAIAGYLTGRRVLVTGAGGSIGAELCRQITRYAPSELVMLDRDESALHAVQLSITGRALLDDPGVVLCDIRDRGRVEAVFAARRPQVVFHAAALKHLPLLEQYPAEAVITNVLGTLDLLEVAAAHGVERFVNISTDKAADPTSVLGYTKRLAEQLTAHVATQADGTFLSVRFGNVLGSRGSVLTAFRSQVAAGGPVTVTDPEVTRYFMTVEEAVQLVIQAGAIGADGQALVLDMGEPVRIADVARRLVAQARRRVDIVYTGLRPGEKRHEVLLGAGEVDERPVHPLIAHVPVPDLPPEAVRTLPVTGPAEALTRELAALCLGARERG